jgi:hypothetical protein
MEIVVVMLKLITRKILLINQISSCQQVSYYYFGYYLYLARVGLIPLGTGRIGPVSGAPGATSFGSGKGGKD